MRGRSAPPSVRCGAAAARVRSPAAFFTPCGDIELEPFPLFLIVFVWTPPHFWALSLNRADEYARADAPILPVVAGRAATTRQILTHNVVLVPISMPPWARGLAGTIYALTAAACGAIFAALASQLGRTREGDRRAAHRLFTSCSGRFWPAAAAIGPPYAPWTRLRARFDRHRPLPRRSRSKAGGRLMVKSGEV